MAAIRRGCFEIPEDVTIEILARLPVNSLLRFKCVCKSWYALTKSPIFISKHLNYAPSNHDNARIIAITFEYPNTGRACVSFFSSNAARKLSQDVTIPFFGTNNNELWNILIYGPCNGIICVHGKTYSGNMYGDHHQIALWNPATREIKHVPWEDNHYEKFKVQVGFGFDRKSNDYKVIRIIDFRPDKCFLETVEAEDRLVEIYRTSTNCWSKLDVVLPKMYIGMESSAYSNGLYYKHSMSDKFVFSFDFADEVFETIPSPHLDNNLQHIKLLNFDETIALVGERIEDEFEPILDAEFWVLNMKGEDGAKKTWTESYKIPFGVLNVVGFLRGGEALVAVEDTFASYDPNTQQLTNIRVYDHAIRAYHKFKVVNYVESLVSFDGAYVLHPTG